MSKIILSADCTCDLGPVLKERYSVNYYPCPVVFQGKAYPDDGLVVTPEMVYDEYCKTKTLPTTSAANVQDYIDYFKPWVDQGCEVIHLNIGSAISAGHQNAKLAAAQLEGVYPVDSCNLSTGIGLLVIRAAEMIEQGMSAPAIVEQLKGLTSKSHASFVLDTLKFMSAGGRCSSVVALGANILGLKPCIRVDNSCGAMSVGKKYRGSLEQALVGYVRDTLAEHKDALDLRRIFITHSGIDEKYVDLVKQTIAEIATFEETFVTRASCSVSIHCGPNTLGILFMTK